MAKFDSLMDAGEGMHQLTQYGVKFPDGTVQWGDPLDSSRVTIDTNLLPYDSPSQYSLVPGSDSYKGFPNLNKAFRVKLKAQRAADASLALVCRTFMVVAGATEVPIGTDGNEMDGLR